MISPAISDWQLVLYAAPLVMVIALIAAAMMKWSERLDSAAERGTDQLPSVAHLPSSRTDSIGTINPVSTRSRRLSGEVLACPECSIRLASNQLDVHRAQAHDTVRRCPLCNQYVRVDRLLQHNVKNHGVQSEEPLSRPQLQCPRCHNQVLRQNMMKHLGRIHGMGSRPAVGGHPVVMALQRQGDPIWLIDGLNVVRLQGEDVPRFDFLLALTHRMLRENVDFLCVFDASARPCIKELQGTYFAEVCERLIRRWPHRFSEVPARTVADVALLDIATMLGSKIITNDQYRDHFSAYPWLETESDERLCGIRLRRTTRPHREVLVWQDARIEVPVPQKIRAFVQEYQELLAERDHSTPAAPA